MVTYIMKVGKERYWREQYWTPIYFHNEHQCLGILWSALTGLLLLCPDMFDHGLDSGVCIYRPNLNFRKIQGKYPEYLINKALANSFYISEIKLNDTKPIQVVH